jgi:hypothetical protein
MRRARLTAVLLADFAIVILCRGDEPAKVSASRALAAGSSAQFRGSGSCSAVACHGSIKSFDRSISKVRRNEHTTWMSDDAHSRAFQVLFDKRSEHIEANLAKSEGGLTKAPQDLRCLVCHTTPRPPAELAATRWLNADGVGCESCHGASEKWLGPHTAGPWFTKDRREKEDRGLWNTKDLTRRAIICAGCHVGKHSPDGLIVRDVNHDLIAAGHPRLNFELAAFLDNMPSHWDEKAENADPNDPNRRAANFSARAWVVGRLTTTQAALALLESRVAEAEAPPEPLEARGSSAVKRTPRWPEFSEYGCFSCHHDLRDQPWRRGPRLEGVAPGSPRWGTWILPGTSELLAQLAAEPDARSANLSLNRVAIAMEKPAPLPELRAAAHDAAGLLEKSLARVTTNKFDVATIQRLIERFDSAKAWDNVASWDEAAGRYLALVPLYQSWLAQSPGQARDQQALRERLDALLDHLRFPKGFDSPRGFEPGRLLQKP